MKKITMMLFIKKKAKILKKNLPHIYSLISNI